MKIDGMVHCMFEQSGTFKKEFKKLGIYAEDYDIQDNFGETDHIVDLETRDGRWRDYKVSQAEDVTREAEFLIIRAASGWTIYINVADIVFIGQTEEKP